MSIDNFFASIDIGSSKIIALIGEKKDSIIEVIGYGIIRTTEAKNLPIEDIDKVSETITTVLEQACSDCNVKMHSVSVNICDPGLISKNQGREISIHNDIIAKDDVKLAIKNSSTISKYTNRQILSTFVNNFIIDQDFKKVRVNKPIGLQSHILEARVHINIVTNQIMSNIQQVMKKSNLGIDKIVLDTIASSEVYISQDEKVDGICLVDIGAATTKISVFNDGGVVYSNIFPLGGDDVTKDIAYAFNTSLNEAERLKTSYGSVQIGVDRLIKFNQLNSTIDHYLYSCNLDEVVQQSYLKILNMLKKDLKSKKLYQTLKSGFVLIGGAVLITALKELFIKNMQTRTKLGQVDTSKISSSIDIISKPIYATALGLLLSADDKSYMQSEQKHQQSGLMSKMKTIFETEF